MRRFLLPVALCILLQLQQVHGEEAAAASEQQADDSSSHDDPSRVKRAMDMRRLSRGIQMLRLGKRAENNDDELLDLLSAIEGGYDYPLQEADDEPHYRYRRSAATEPTETPDFGEVQDNDPFIGEDDGQANLLQKRPMNMLRLGKRPMNMLRLGKRPMNMLRLGKRPMNMLRLGKRPMNMLRLGKRPMNMLRLGKRLFSDDQNELAFDDVTPVDFEEGFGAPEKRQLNMLRLGKRQGEDDGSMYLPIEEGEYIDDQEPEALSTLEKRPMNMLRLGKRPMNMLRLGKRPMNMLRLGKRPMNMLRLGKRPMNMLRLGKRPMNMLRLGKRPMNMLRLGKRPKRQIEMLRLGKRENKEEGTNQ